jgi:nicotinate-nucleotide adenylyltransferase
MKKVMLFFGSFNPIHVGHLILASTILNETHINNIWFVVSPQNPFKQLCDLAPFEDRCNMVSIAIRHNYDFRLCTIENDLPVPSYTYNTLRKLKEQHPDIEFSLLMGSDTYTDILKWKNCQEILEHEIFVFPRDKFDNVDLLNDKTTIIIIGKPFIEISSTVIRDLLNNNKSIEFLVTEKVQEYIVKNKLFLK